MPIALGVGSLLRPRMPIVAGLSSVLGSMMAAGLGAVMCLLADLGPDRLLGRGRCVVTLGGKIVAKRGVVIALVGCAVALVGSLVPTVGGSVTFGASVEVRVNHELGLRVSDSRAS